MKKKPSHQAFYYRNRKFLSKRCGEIPLSTWWNTSSKFDRKLANLLGTFGPLDSRDLKDPKMRRRLLEWKKHCPMDPAFFRHFLRWEKVWRDHSGLPLSAFMQSEVFESWVSKRKRLKRKTYFELDGPYRPSNPKVLKQRLAIKALIRRQPLLRYEDLKALKIKSAQKIFEGLPDLKRTRLKYLQRLQRQMARSKY